MTPDEQLQFAKASAEILETPYLGKKEMYSTTDKKGEWPDKDPEALVVSPTNGPPDTMAKI